MDLNVAVIAGRLSTAPQLRNGGHEATLRLVCQRPAHPGRPPAAVDLVDVLVDTALATHVADFLVEGCRLIVGGRLERRPSRSGTATLHLVATMLQILEPRTPPTKMAGATAPPASRRPLDGRRHLPG